MTATPAHRRLAAEIAGKSLVLLRNDGILPLRPDVASIAVIGPNADEARHLVGDYAYAVHVESLQEVLRSGRNVFDIPIDEQHSLDAVVIDAPSVLAELRTRFGDRVRFARGCDVNSAERTGFAEAVALAAECDVAVMVMGDKAGLTDDCTSGESRDVASLDLPGRPGGARPTPCSTPGTPVVLVLVAGRPIGSAALHERCAAVLMAWLPGEEGGAAIADALTRRRQPRRQAADHLPAVGRADPRVLRPQAVRRAVALEGRLRRLSGGPAVPVRPRPQLHDVRAQRCVGRARRGVVERRDHDDGDGHQHRRSRRRRGRPAVRPRSVGERHPAGARAEGLRARQSRRRASHGGSRSRLRSASSGSTTATSPTSSSRARSTSSSARRRVDLVEAGTRDGGGRFDRPARQSSSTAP